jgi:hypothetical protein
MIEALDKSTISLGFAGISDECFRIHSATLLKQYSEMVGTEAGVLCTTAKPKPQVD